MSNYLSSRIWSINHHMKKVGMSELNGHTSSHVLFLGWICKVQIADTNELDDLMNEDEYETFCQEEA